MKEQGLFLVRMLFLALTLLSVGSVFFSKIKKYRFALDVWRLFTWKIFFQCLGILILTMIVGILLSSVPGLDFGWTQLVYHTAGNITVKPVTDAQDSPYLLLRLCVPIFLLVLGSLFPFLAYAEEKAFRKGYITWGSIVRQSLMFGLMHAIIGIPLGFALALSIPGFFLACKYRKAYLVFADMQSLPHNEVERLAVMTSTVYHTMHNTIALMIGFVVSLSNL